MPDQNPFPQPYPPPKGPPSPAPPENNKNRIYGDFFSLSALANFYLRQGGKAATFVEGQLFDSAVVDPTLTAIEEFAEEKAARVPVKKVFGGTGLFIIEHTIISHTSKSADALFVTVLRADGTTYRYADTSVIPRRLDVGDRVIDGPPGAKFILTRPNNLPIPTSAGGPLGDPVADGGVLPERVRPVNAKAMNNEERAEGIRRQLVSERADP